MASLPVTFFLKALNAELELMLMLAFQCRTTSTRSEFSKEFKLYFKC